MCRGNTLCERVLYFRVYWYLLVYLLVVFILAKVGFLWCSCFYAFLGWYVWLCDLDGAPLRGYVMEDLRFVVNTNGLPVGCDVDRVQVVGGSAVRDVGRVDLSDDCGFIVVSDTYPVRSVSEFNRVVLEFFLVSPDGVRNEVSLSMRSDGVWKESWRA